ncbi:hypothetical protein [Planctomicrobium sp. SH664]|uniref:hypothetical protein n=1 Tax=Planctomicrobium sp. SH664 TaxID=3448125 RepID=UPI003F5BC32C
MFEVVIAVSIFFGAMAVISQILRNGTRASVRANMGSDAIVRCERCLSEVLTGILPLESVQGVPFADDPAWTYTINVVDSGTLNLLRVEAVVQHLGPDGTPNASFELVRMIRDPLALIEPETAIPEEEAF